MAAPKRKKSKMLKKLVSIANIKKLKKKINTKTFNQGDLMI